MEWSTNTVKDLTIYSTFNPNNKIIPNVSSATVSYPLSSTYTESLSSSFLGDDKIYDDIKTDPNATSENEKESDDEVFLIKNPNVTNESAKESSDEELETDFIDEKDLDEIRSIIKSNIKDVQLGIKFYSDAKVFDKITENVALKCLYLINCICGVRIYNNPSLRYGNGYLIVVGLPDEYEEEIHDYYEYVLNDYLNFTLSKE